MTTGSDLPNIVTDAFVAPSPEKLERTKIPHQPRILLLYGSLRERSYSRLLTLEAARLLESFGAQTRIFNPSGLPLPDDVPKDHPKVRELRSLTEWSEGQVWCSCVDGAPLASSFFLDAIWSGAVMCPACWCGALTAGPDVVRRPGPHHRIALCGADTLSGCPCHRFDPVCITS
jgi:hypothetical protein